MFLTVYIYLCMPIVYGLKRATTGGDYERKSKRPRDSKQLTDGDSCTYLREVHFITYRINNKFLWNLKYQMIRSTITETHLPYFLQKMLF